MFVGHAPHGTHFDFDARMLMFTKTVIVSTYGSARLDVGIQAWSGCTGPAGSSSTSWSRGPIRSNEVNQAFAALAEGHVGRSVLALA